VTRHTSLLELIGRTPVLELRGWDTGAARVFLKLESFNPGGSIKDRIALHMIEGAERRGRLRPGGWVVEGTAGNTGIALALVALLRGYRLLLVVPDKMSAEKIAQLRAMGAEVVLTRSDVTRGHPEYYLDLAKRLAEQRGGLFIDQFGNPDNPAAHEASTGPEIWEEFGPELDVLVLGAGTSGTLTGLGRYLKARRPELRIVLADPEGSVLAGYHKTGRVGPSGRWLVEGIGEDYLPSIGDFSLVDDVVTVGDAEAFRTARDLLRTTGVAGGSSTGVLLAAALRVARASARPTTVLTFVCDQGTRYMTRVYDPRWLARHALDTDERTDSGDLRDFLPADDLALAAGRIAADAPGETALKRMRDLRLDALLVRAEPGGREGLLLEEDLLRLATTAPEGLAAPVASVVRRDPPRLPASEPEAALLALLERVAAAVVSDPASGHALGAVTRSSALDRLERRRRVALRSHAR
jgi:cystathionine beta-synthase